MLKKSIIILSFLFNCTATQVLGSDSSEMENDVNSSDSCSCESMNNYFAFNFYKNERKLIVWNLSDESYCGVFEKVVAHNFDAMKNVLFVATESGTFAVAVWGNIIYLVDSFGDEKNAEKIEFYRKIAADFSVSNYDKNYDNFIEFWAQKNGYSKELAKTKERGAFRVMQQFEQNAYFKAINGTPKPYNWNQKQ